MMATTAKRVLVSESKKTVSSLETNDWKLTITSEGETGKAVTMVNVSGNKGNAFINYSKNGQQTNINFNGIDYDSDLLAAIKVEVDDITKPVS